MPEWRRNISLKEEVAALTSWDQPAFVVQYTCVK